MLKVRKDAVFAYLESKLINPYFTDLRNLTMRDLCSLHALGPGVGSWQDADSLSLIQLVEITGTGKRLPHAK